MLLDIKYFYELTPRQFQNIANGYSTKIERQSEQSWEQSRMIAFYAVVAHSKNIKSPKQILEFDWEKEFDLSEVDDRTAKQKLKDIKEFWKKVDNNGSTDS